MAYVYIHRRPDNSIFYVGKGINGRSHQTRGRNSTWKEIAAGGFSVGFIKTDIDDDFAYLLEREAINVLIRRGIKLCNRTPGGEGYIGFKHSAEHREKMKGNKYGATSGFYSFKGRHHSEEQKKIWSERRSGVDSGKRKGAIFTEEHKQKLRASKTGIANLWNRKLTDDEVREIRSKVSGYRAIASTAREYGVGESTIRRIRDSVLYKDVK